MHMGGGGVAEALRSGNTSEYVNRGILTEEELADPLVIQKYATDLTSRISDPDEFVVSAVDFMTVGWKSAE